MARSMTLGHCVCNPRKSCPCDAFIEQDLCPCAGERPEPPKEEIRLTKYAGKAGCASKINRADLQLVLENLPNYPDPNVLVGVAAGDDAGVYRLDGEYNLVETVDVFSPVVDDPYTFGQICAANSLSDVYAMGGRPICALSIIGFPIEELPREVMTEILRGGIDKMHEAGVSVIGGHSINDEEIKGGFAVTGLVRGNGSVTNDGAKPGDRLVLTKPIGTGIVSFAAQIGLASEEAISLIARSMATLNKDAALLMVEFGAHACTDVTGFGLIGHLSEMARHSGVSAVIDAARVPVFAEALGCVRQEIIPGATERNRESFGDGIITTGGNEDGLLDLLFDAQTSGGLLVSLPAEKADAYVEALRRRGHEATSDIGEIVAQQGPLIEVILNEPANLVGTYRAPERVPKVEEVCCETPPTAMSCCGHQDQDEIPCCTKTAEPETQENRMTSTGKESAQAFMNMMKTVGQGGVVDARTKRLVSVALSIAQRCEPCFITHATNALKEGITREEIEEIAWVAISFTGCTGRMFYLDMMKRIGGD